MLFLDKVRRKLILGLDQNCGVHAARKSDFTTFKMDAGGVLEGLSAHGTS